MLSLQNYLKGRERKFAQEFSDDKKKNAHKMVARASELLSAFGEKREVVLGWVPVNIAKRDGVDIESPHIWGQAIALKDFDKRLGHWCVENIERLIELELFMETLSATHQGEYPFVRLQIARPECGNRIFSSN
jgi:hypothetical protein